MYLKMYFAATTVPATSTVFRAWISADNLVLMIFRYGTADPFQCSSFCDVKMERTVTLWNRWTSWHLPVTKNNNNQTHITKLNRIWNYGNCYVVQRYVILLCWGGCQRKQCGNTEIYDVSSKEYNISVPYFTCQLNSYTRASYRSSTRN